MSIPGVGPGVYWEMIDRLRGALIVVFATAAILTAAPGVSTRPAFAGSAADPLPPEIATHFTPQDVARGRAYMVGRYRAYVIGVLLQLAALTVLVFTPASAALRNLAVR